MVEWLSFGFHYCYTILQAPIFKNGIIGAVPRIEGQYLAQLPVLPKGLCLLLMEVLTVHSQWVLSSTNFPWHTCVGANTYCGGGPLLRGEILCIGLLLLDIQQWPSAWIDCLHVGSPINIL